MENKIYLELEEACNPLRKFLEKYYDLECQAVISLLEVKITRNEIGLIVKEKSLPQ